MAIAVMLHPTTQGLREVGFKFDGRRIAQARSVTLVGAFNRWDASGHRLTLQANQWWTISLTLAPGRYPYLFLVDGVPWNDPQDDGRAPCEWGGSYSLRVVH